MMAETGCAGVVVGRGCLGRPWLFAELKAALAGEAIPELPHLHQVRDVMIRHGHLLVDFFENEGRAMRDLRKHMAWYLKGFSVPREIRSSLGMVSSLGELEYLLSSLEDQPYPTMIAETPRGRRSHGRAVALPDGWLNDPDEFASISIDDAVSGG
jgi:tRNA-dihydrouridine synthase